jgi:membrane protease YdiL (CAAX protease family)
MNDPLPSAPRWPLGSARSIGFSLVVFIAHMAVMFGFGTLLLILFGVDPRTIPEAPLLAILALVIATSLDVGIVYIGLLCRFGRMTLAELGWTRFQPRDIALGLAGAAVLVAMVFVAMCAASGSFHGGVEQLVSALTDVSPRERCFGILLGLSAAFTEETLFRGYMQPTVQRRLGRWIGLSIVALFFAVQHGRFDPSLLLGKIGVGLLLALIRERTGTLWAGAIAHTLQWTILYMA